MRLVDAYKVGEEGNVTEVWIDDGPLPAIGATFEADGASWVRVPNGAPMSFGRELDFKRPVTMWSEPLHGRGPVRAPHYDGDGFAVFTNNRQLREYEARSKDTGRPVTWTK